MGRLTKLYDKYKTDKGTVFFHAHNYGEFYEEYFKHIREKMGGHAGDKIKILEIGVLNGSSIKAHEEYFGNCEIYGIDIDVKCKQYESDNVKIFICDSSNDDSLIDFKRNIGDTKFDIILDDGSHRSKDQWRALINLFDLVNDGGIYIIEDLHMNKYFNDENPIQSPCACLPLRFKSEYLTNEETILLYNKIDKIIIWSRSNEKMNLVYPPISVTGIITFKKK